MITHKEMVKVICQRYNLDAATANQQAKSDVEIIHFCNRKDALRTIESYNKWMDEMEELGS